VVMYLVEAVVAIAAMVRYGQHRRLPKCTADGPCAVLSNSWGVHGGPLRADATGRCALIHTC
jgi:hypothetical protein